jgi:aspartyl/glutamyl-tRNA(Asn/Gln) amidotransferase C subunit
MAMVEQLQEVDTTGVEPLFHVGAAHNATRQDELEQTDAQEMGRLMSDEQRIHAGLYKVKKVL